MENKILAFPVVEAETECVCSKCRELGFRLERSLKLHVPLKFSHWQEGMEVIHRCENFGKGIIKGSRGAYILVDWADTRTEPDSFPYNREELLLNKKSKLEISFGYTKDEILAGIKECTRRDWKDSHAAKFIKAYEQDLKIRAIDKDRRAGGKQIGWVTLTQRPYQQHIGAMTEADLKAEGGMCQTVDEFCDRYFSGDLEKVVWVIWFKFEPLAETLTAPTPYRGFIIGDRIIQNGNNPEWGEKNQLASLIQYGQIIDICPIPECPKDELHPQIQFDNGSIEFGIWDCMTKIDPQIQSLPMPPSHPSKTDECALFEEVVKALSGDMTTHSAKEPGIEWVENSRAIYKGEPCQVIQLGTGSYRNKAKITTADFEEKWVYLNQLAQLSSSTNSSAESADLARPQESPEASPHKTTSILTPTPKPSTDTITLPLPSTQIFAPITQTGEVMPMRSDSLAPAHQVRVLALDSITPNPVFGLKPCDASSKGIQTLWSLKTLKVLSTEDYGKFLEDSEWLDIRGALRNSYQQLGSAIPTSGTECSLLPTPTTYPKGSGNYRPAGQTKLELTLRPHFLKGEKLNPQAMGWMMGFRPGYVEDVLMPVSSAIQLPEPAEFLTTPQNGEQLVTSTAEASCPSKLRSHSAESSTSTQSLENEVMVQSAERTTPSIETQNLEERIFAILPEDGTEWIAASAISRELDIPLTTVLEALDKLGKAERIWKKGDKWCRKLTQKEEAFDRYIESRINSEGEDSPPQSEYPRVEKLSPQDIILDMGTQSRFKEDEEQIHYYKESMECGDWDFDRKPLPEVLLAPDGKYYPVDCHHRVKAMIRSLHPGRLVPFLVHKGTLAQARIWSTTANTKNGLGADESPQGVRKRIEMFLDNVAELSEEEYTEEFSKVPDLTPREKSQGKFSSRTIARYLRLRSGQDRTVSNIMKERELAAKISQFFIGDRVEVFFAEGIEEDKRPKEFAAGDAGTIHDKDTKVGLWVKWDKLGNAEPFPINPDFVKPSTQPKPKPIPAAARTSTPTSITGSTEGGGSVTFTGKAQESRVLPDIERNEDETAQEERTPSPIPPGVFQSGSKVRVTNPNTVFYGRQGIVTSFPNNNDALVDLEATDTEPATKERIAQRDLTRESTPVVEVRKLIHTPVAEQVNLVEAVRTVVDNLHLLKPEELAALEDAIAQAKRSWSEAA